MCASNREGRRAWEVTLRLVFGRVTGNGWKADWGQRREGVWQLPLHFAAADCDTLSTGKIAIGLLLNGLTSERKADRKEDGPHEWHNFARDENPRPRLTETPRRLKETIGTLGLGHGDESLLGEPE